VSYNDGKPAGKDALRSSGQASATARRGLEARATGNLTCRRKKRGGPVSYSDGEPAGKDALRSSG
jgi:hypothetical protein